VPVKFKRRQKKPKGKKRFNAKPGTGMAVIVTRETAGVSTQTGSDALPQYTPTHYVAPHSLISGVSSDGDAQTAGDYSNATSSNDPCTLQCAMVNATAGDVVRVAPGDYSKNAPDLDRSIAAWRPTNSGISGSPIVFYAQNRSGLTYQAGVTSRVGHTGDAGPTLGVNAEDWITLDGFMVDESLITTTADTGPVVCWYKGTANPIIGIKLLSLVVLGDTTSWTDNHNGIRMEGTDQCVIRDCYISNVGSSGGANSNAGNVVGIMTYTCTDIEIDHNTIVGCSGIHIKEAQPGNAGPDQYGVKVHHNWIDMEGAVNASSSASGIRFTTSQTDVLSDIYQNVVINHFGSFLGSLNLGSAQGQDGVRWVNNTIYVSGRAGFAGAGSFSPTIYTVRNNIFSSCVSAFHDFTNWSESQLLSFAPFDYNIYQYSDFYDADGFGALESYTYSQFTANSDAEDNSPASFDNPSNAQINFMDAANDDFRLDTGSIALNGGTDFLNLLGGGTSAPINCGAYILADQSDQIGRRT
jgi:hypothetical protein